MKFEFKAKSQTGSYTSGVIDAFSKDAAIAYLQKNNLLPISLVESSAQTDLAKAFLRYYDRVNQKELIEFFRQLAILIDARVPIVVSLTAIFQQTNNKFLAKVIQEIIGDIENGLSFSSAMEKHKNVFSNLAINIIKAGESSGNLKKAIDYVATNVERNYNLSSRIKAALTYPCIILFVFFVIGFLAVSFIIPKLTAIIKEMEATVPWYTSVVIVISDFMKDYWWAVAIILIGISGGILYYIKTQEGKREWDQIKIKIPIIGVLFRYTYITRFAENLSILLSGGIPIIRALTIVSAVMNNVVYEALVLSAAQEVKIGGNMSKVFQRTTLMPPMVTHMIKIGEESGQIDSVLTHISEFYERELEVITKNLSSMLEPVLMVIIGVAVGFMAFAILMPIYNIAGQIH